MSEVIKIVLTTIDMIAVFLVLLSMYHKKDDHKGEITAMVFILINALGMWV